MFQVSLSSSSEDLPQQFDHRSNLLSWTRYSYGGKPLLATQDRKSPDKCRHCDSPMLFEMQLMPALIYFLHEGVVDKAVKQSLDNWDWMTLILYTCSKVIISYIPSSTTYIFFIVLEQ